MWNVLPRHVNGSFPDKVRTHTDYRPRVSDRGGHDGSGPRGSIKNLAKAASSSVELG